MNFISQYLLKSTLTFLSSWSHVPKLFLNFLDYITCVCIILLISLQYLLSENMIGFSNNYFYPHYSLVIIIYTKTHKYFIFFLSLWMKLFFYFSFLLVTSNAKVFMFFYVYVLPSYFTHFSYPKMTFVSRSYS